MSLNTLNDKLAILNEQAGQDKRKALDIAIEVANEVIKILQPSVSSLPTGEDALDEAIPINQFPNQKIESWFTNHPYFTGDKVALRFYTSELIETKFYWLSDSATKARVSAGVMLTPNWEDSELTRNDNYKVGIDFFLSSNAKSLLVVVSNSGNLRILELTGRLSHTQREILAKLQGAFNLSSQAQIHKSIWDALALSEVNKKFYAGIAEQFNILLNHLIKDGKDKEDAKLFASRLLGRLLFLWFLRKKGIIDEKFRYFDLENANSTNYYNTKLKKLFFETLNTPVHERKGEDITTPYLNGGLFEAHDNDWPHQIVGFPAGFFNGLYEHLGKYNFTTDESSPEYEQVAIDPEMLGRVFESLLASQITETGDQARKAKGAFYTPREIVSYMCRESLRQYLYKKLDNEAWNEGIDKLLDSSDSDWEINNTNSKRNLWGEANLNTVPRLVIGALDNLTVFDPACGSGAFPMGILQLVLKTYERLDSRFDPYKTKLQIIQNNIFGADIEPMAVEISRLRAWLSLIVEDEDSAKNIDPLPNLDFKFVCANSLVSLEQQSGLFTDPMLHEKLAEVRTKFFNARKPETKDKWKKEYHKLTNDKQTSLYSDKRETQLKSFDPFKNAHHAEFFDADYMFGIELFDVVIGNPPYIHFEKMDKNLREDYKKLAYKTFEARGDIYTLFYEQGVNLLKQDGVLAYITSNKWMRAAYGKSLRDYFVQDTAPLSIIDLGGGIFDSATVDTNIIITRKASYAQPTTAVATTSAFDTKNMSDYIKQNSISTTFKIGSNWSILNATEQRIKDKIEHVGTPLSEWDIKINRGLLTGLNEAFIIDEITREKLISNDPKSAELIRPILRGKDIKRYNYTFADQYVILTKFDSHRTLKNEYPAIYGHLKKFEDKLKERGQCRYTSSGKTLKPTDANYPGYPGMHHWLELDNNPRQSYLDDFNRQKIVWGNLNKQATYSLAGEGMVINAPSPIIVPASKYLLAVLNSKLADYYIRGLGVTRNGGYFEYKPMFVKQLPVPISTDSEQHSIVSLIEQRLMAKDADDIKKIEAAIDQEVYSLYSMNDEEIAFIKAQ